MKPLRIQPVLLGLGVIALGIVWLLRNLGIVEVDIGDLFATYWPVLLIVWGIDALVSAIISRAGEESRRGVFSGAGLVGLFLLVLGLVILGRNMGLYWVDLSILFRILWPAVIILIGWSLIRGASGCGGTRWAVMSGIDLKNRGWRLEDGNYIAIMGGANLDLTCADIPDKETVLNLTAVMGGINVKVPADLEVECEGTAILGGVKFFDEEGGGVVAARRTIQEGVEGSQKKVTIRAWTLMGGIEVKRG
ncbi:MAG: cell wall-active antibiotics response protein LiaF [Bacillota bacterium]